MASLTSPKHLILCVVICLSVNSVGIDSEKEGVAVDNKNYSRKNSLLSFLRMTRVANVVSMEQKRDLYCQKWTKYINTIFKSPPLGRCGFQFPIHK